MRRSPLQLAFGGMIALAVGMGVGRFVYTPILPVMVEALSLTASQAGLIASANFLGYLAGALLASLRIFNGSQHGYLMMALAANAFGLAAMGLTADFALHLILRFIAGVASAFILVFSSALVLERLAAEGRDRLSALHFAGVGVGVTLSAAAVALLLSGGAGWDTLWLVSGAMGLAGLAVSAFLVAPSAPLPAAPASAASPPSRASPALRAIILAYGLFGFGYVITATFIVAIVRDTPSLQSMEAYVWVLFGLSAAPSVVFWMAIGARAGIIPAFAAACVVEAIGVASSILWQAPAGIVLSMLFLGGTVMGITALGLIAVRRLSKGDPRPNLALMTASFGAGQVIGPVFAGVVVDRLGSFLVPTLAAAFMLLVAAGLAGLAARLDRSDRRSPSAGA